jgi:Holliday junction resolvasome RuvABC endonuclease subunit
VGITRRQFSRLLTPLFAARHGFRHHPISSPHPETLAHGTISCPKNWERSRCLAKISQTLREEIKKHQPTVCVIEGLFFAQNLQNRH